MQRIRALLRKNIKNKELGAKMGAYSLLICKYLDWLRAVVPDGREGAVIYEVKYTTR